MFVVVLCYTEIRSISLVHSREISVIAVFAVFSKVPAKLCIFVVVIEKLIHVVGMWPWLTVTEQEAPLQGCLAIISNLGISCSCLSKSYCSTRYRVLFDTFLIVF